MSNPLNKLYLANVGVLAPLGNDIKSIHCAWQAGINTYAESFVYGQELLPLTMSLVPDDALPVLDDDDFKKTTYRDNRVVRLCCGAISQLDAQLIEEHKIPLFLASYEVLKTYSKGPCRDLLHRVCHHSGVKFNIEQSRIFATGRAAGAHALEYAFKYMEATGHQYCIVGGVDSYLDLYLLKQLDLEGRIKKAGSMDAFTPAEGASFLLLSAQAMKYNNSEVALCRPGLVEEPGHRYSDQPYTGEALSQAIGASLNYANGQKITTLYSSANGESFGTKEYGVAMIRLAKSFDENCSHEHPADCYGDLGAASVTTLLALAGQNKEKNALIVGASDASYRGVVKLESV